MPTETEGTPTLSLLQAKALLRDIILALDLPDVSEALEAFVAAAQGDRQLTIQLVMPFVNRVQAQVVSKYGFEPSTAGVVAFGRSIEPHKADSAVRQLLILLQSRMMPSPQQAQMLGTVRQERQRLGVRLHDMEDNGAMYAHTSQCTRANAHEHTRTDMEHAHVISVRAYALSGAGARRPTRSSGAQRRRFAARPSTQSLARWCCVAC